MPDKIDKSFNNFTKQYNRDLGNVCVKQSNNLSSKEIAFKEILEGVEENELTKGKSGKDVIDLCLSLQLQNGSGPVDTGGRRYESLIKELGKNANSYFGTKVFTRGLQKLLAVGYIYDNSGKAFNSNGTFNYRDFKDWIGKNFGANVSDNLNEKYYTHILFDPQRKVIKFGNSEYRNELTEGSVIVKRLISFKNLNNLPTDVANYCLKERKGEFKNKILEGYKETLIEDRGYLQKFQHKYIEDYKKFWKDGYFMLKAEDIGRPTLRKFVAETEKIEIKNREDHNAFVQKYPDDKMQAIVRDKAADFDKFLQRPSVQENELNHMQLFAKSYKEKFKSFFFDKEYEKYKDNPEKAIGLNGVGADQLTEMIEFYLTNDNNIRKLGEIFEDLGVNASNYSEAVINLNPGLMHFAVAYFENPKVKDTAIQTDLLSDNRTFKNNMRRANINSTSKQIEILNVNESTAELYSRETQKPYSVRCNIDENKLKITIEEFETTEDIKEEILSRESIGYDIKENVKISTATNKLNNRDYTFFTDYFKRLINDGIFGKNATLTVNYPKKESDQIGFEISFKDKKKRDTLFTNTAITLNMVFNTLANES